MRKTRTQFYQEIRENIYLNPFSESFDIKKANLKLDEDLSQEETDSLDFICSCNDCYIKTKQNVFKIYDMLGLDPDNLFDELFLFINNHYLLLTSKLRTVFKEKRPYEAEEMSFAKFSDDQNLNVQFAFEIGVDILAELVELIKEWSPNFQVKKTSSNEVHDKDKLFFILFMYINTIINLNRAYEIIKYENGNVIVFSDGSLKIESGMQQILLLKQVGLLRAQSNEQEFLYWLSQSPDIMGMKTKSLVCNYVNQNTLFLKPEITNEERFLRAKSSLFVFYPHFINQKLKYFNDCTLEDLLYLLAILEDCINNWSRNVTNHKPENKTANTPIRFGEQFLIDKLSEISGHSQDTVKKFIYSIASDDQKPYFWKFPLYRKRGYLYFTFSALTAPNYLLFLDKWTTLSGYTLEDKENMLTEYFENTFSGDKNISKFKCYPIPKTNLGIAPELFKNNIIFETTSLLIFVEVKVFDFPIEPWEINASIERLVEGTFSIKPKLQEFKEKYKREKEIFEIIVTNYPDFSGLIVNNIPVVDLTLFNNYVVTGAFRKAAILFEKRKPTQSSGNEIKYYNNDIEFNTSLKSFFKFPVPVFKNLERLYLRLQQIVPEDFVPKISIDVIDHLEYDQIMASRIGNVANLLNYEYYQEPKEKKEKEQLDQEIMHSLYEVFLQLCHAPYQSSMSRVDLYYNLKKTRLVGFAHFAFFMLKNIQKLDGKKIEKIKQFNSVNYEPEITFKLMDRIKDNLSGLQRFSEFIIEKGIYTIEEERVLISAAIDLLAVNLNLDNFKEEDLEGLSIPLLLIIGLRERHNLSYEIFNIFSNLVDSLNYIHKYQAARDLCEELLIMAIKDNQYSHGWSLLFKCYTSQRNTLEASIYGCLFITSVSVSSSLPYFLAVDVYYGAMKFFRNFGFIELVRYMYENTKLIELSEYDEQKITLSYFNSLLANHEQINKDLSNKICKYIEYNCESIIKYKKFGTIPWLMFCYNYESIKINDTPGNKALIRKNIERFEQVLAPDSYESLKVKVVGNIERSKDVYVSALLNVLETRSVSDFIYEAKNLRLFAHNLLEKSLIEKDLDGLLLSGIIINDQSSNYNDISLPKGELIKFISQNEESKKIKLNNYVDYILKNLFLGENCLFLWFFEHNRNVYLFSINSDKEWTVDHLDNWNWGEMKKLSNKVGGFSFNAKKDRDDKPICEYSNPRGEQDYNDLVQREDYHNLLNALSFSNTAISHSYTEIYISLSLEMSGIPFNLININNDFAASQVPICNVLSIENFVERCDVVKIRSQFSLSAWIPIEDKEPTISWGYKLLLPILKQYNTHIYESTYPKEQISTDINIFLAHGIRDETGFKAIYTNHEEKVAITHPLEVFGTGEIAILFICNSGSSEEEIFANSVLSFSLDLLSAGYKAVIASFWPFDVTMSKIWLEEFLAAFKTGFSVSESVWLGNYRLSKYDEETSSMFLAPAGCLAMHLHGNPNIYVQTSDV